MFHVFSLVCFLIYGVKSRSGHDRSQSFVHSTEINDGGGIKGMFSVFVWICRFIISLCVCVFRFWDPSLLKKSLILMKNHKIINRNIEVVKLEILKIKTWFCDKDLLKIIKWLIKI